MNDELLALYTADREERVDQPRMGTPEYTAMRERDQQRRLRAAAILSSLTAPEAADLYHAALLFQHGDEPEDAWRAYALAREATERGDERARWLTAAAYDRWLMYQDKPQKYGTQYVSDGIRHRLWDVDPDTTDAERAAWNVPSLAEQLRKAEEATRIDPPQPINLDDAPWWLKRALLRWRASAGLSEQ
jgi:hypothetical protein